MQISIRQSGGANIVSLPKTVLKMLKLHTGSMLTVTVEDHKIVLTPSEEQLTLEVLLEGSPKANFQHTEEDKEWIETQPRGREAW